jgi:hypothetical protein
MRKSGCRCGVVGFQRDRELEVGFFCGQSFAFKRVVVSCGRVDAPSQRPCACWSPPLSPRRAMPAVLGLFGGKPRDLPPC